MTDGFRAGFWVGTAVAALGLVASIVLVKGRRAETPQAALAPTA